MPSYTTIGIAKNAVILHTFYKNCNNFFNSSINGQQFSQQFLIKIVAVGLCKGL